MVVVPTVMYDKMRALKSIPLFRLHARGYQCGKYKYDCDYEDNVEFLDCRQCAFLFWNSELNREYYQGKRWDCQIHFAIER